MNRNFSPTSTSAYPHLQSPSPSDMDPADSRHSDPSSKVNSKLQDESSSHSPETPDNTTEYPASPPAEGASSQTSRNGQDESTAEADPFKIATLDQFDKSPANPLKRRSQSPAVRLKLTFRLLDRIANAFSSAWEFIRDPPSSTSQLFQYTLNVCTGKIRTWA